MEQSLNPYLIFLISTLSEAIGYACCSLNDQIGRKRGFVFFLISSSICCWLVAFLPRYNFTSNYLFNIEYFRIALALVGKAMACAAFNSCYIYNSMLYPPAVRSSVLLLTSNFGFIGSYISPHINLLNRWWEPLPYFIFGSSTLLSAIFICILPNPDTVNFE